MNGDALSSAFLDIFKGATGSYQMDAGRNARVSRTAKDGTRNTSNTATNSRIKTIAELDYLT